MVQNLLADVQGYWSTLIVRTPPFPDDLFRQTFLYHKVILSTKPRRTGCHVWRAACEVAQSEVTEIKPDVIVDCYLDAKYCHYIQGAHRLRRLTINQATLDTINACTSIDDNFKELDNACPTCKPETESVNPKWLEYHQSGLLVKDETCPISIEESGIRVGTLTKV